MQSLAPPSLLLNDARRASSTTVQLPMMVLGVRCWACSPASDAVLCVCQSTALFVSLKWARIRQQHVKGLPFATTSVTWGCRGYVAATGLGRQEHSVLDFHIPSLAVCAVGTAPYMLQLLHRLARDSLVVSTWFDIGGLLLFLATHRMSTLDEAHESGFTVMGGRVRVSTCELASGTCHVLRTMDSAESSFSPVDPLDNPSVHLSCVPGEAGLLILGPLARGVSRAPAASKVLSLRPAPCGQLERHPQERSGAASDQSLGLGQAPAVWHHL